MEIPFLSKGKPGDKSSAPIIETSGEAEAVEQITQQVATEYGAGAGIDSEAPFGRKADGTPRKRFPRNPSGRTKKVVANDPSGLQAAPIPTPGEAAGFALDKEIVEKTVKTVLGTVDGFVQRKVLKTAGKLGGDPELCQELAQQSGLTVSEANLMSELTGIIFEKYGLLTGHAPEALLLILLTEYSTRVYLVTRRLNELANMKRARVKREEEAASVPIAQAKQDSDNRKVG